MGIRIALAGNPNCGKTTLFNALTGSNQYVGNWPGVTVEHKEGKLKKKEGVTITDLPGIYSLSPYTLEEVVARNYLLEESPDVILNIVDGSNLERNLYLTTQLMDLGIPVVIAVNMMDIVEKNGDKIDIDKMGRLLGCPVVELSALKGVGIEEAADVAIEAAKIGRGEANHILSGQLEHVIAHIEEAVLHHLPEEEQRWYALKLFERDPQVATTLQLSQEQIDHIEADIVKLEHKLDDDAESIIINDRYNYIVDMLSHCFVRNEKKSSITDRIDRIVTNRVLALPIFALIMFLVYFISIGSIGNWTVNFMNDTLFGEWIVPWVTGSMESIGCWPWLTSLVADGIVGGVGAVLGFVPQMVILFFLLSILEDCGYMSRVAFIMDRIFRKFGLSGKSFIPMLVASGCGVPGIMASRTIEQERDRRMTVMTTGFIPCGAKMPVVSFIAGALFGGSAWVATAAYFIGIGAVIVSGIILKKTKLFAGDPAPFVMELPAYHAPVPANIFRVTWERGWSFVKKAGTVILASSVIIWILNSLTFEGGFHYIGDGTEKSILSFVGEQIAVLFVPLGFGKWQTAVATILGLLAKEEIVSVFGALSGMEGAEGEFGFALQGGSMFFDNALAGFSFLVFNLLCAPCFAAMGAIRREMNNPKWTAFALGYMTVFAYAVSLIIYQFGAWFLGVGSVAGTVAALFALVVILYFLFRKQPNYIAKKK